MQRVSAPVRLPEPAHKLLRCVSPALHPSASRFRDEPNLGGHGQRQPRVLLTPAGMTAPVFVESPARLTHKKDRPVYLIVENHSTQRGRRVKDFGAALAYRPSCKRMLSRSLSPNACERAPSGGRRSSGFRLTCGRVSTGASSITALSM